MAYAATERPVGLRSAADLPEAFGRLAVLVVNADPLGSKTAGRLVGGHTRSLAYLAEVLDRRHRVPGATAPVPLGIGGELRLHGVKQIVLREPLRTWRSAGRDDPAPDRQLNKILHFFSMHRGRLSRSPTDEDLHAAVAALKPALLFAPAMNHAITRQVHGERWQGVDGGGPMAQQYLLSAGQAAQDSAVGLAMWLPDSVPRGTRRPNHRRRFGPPDGGISR